MLPWGSSVALLGAAVFFIRKHVANWLVALLLGLLFLPALISTSQAQVHNEDLPLSVRVSALVRDMNQLTSKINGLVRRGCVSAETYDSLAYEASHYRFDAFFAFGGIFVFGTPSGPSLKKAVEELDEAEAKLKICPPKISIPSMVPATPGAIPPVMELITDQPTTVCKPCVRIIRQMVEIDEKIKKIERSKASLLRGPDAQTSGVQRAVREEDTKIAALRAEREKLAGKLAECEKKCHPGNQSSWTGFNVGGSVGLNKTNGDYQNTQTTSKGGGDPNIDPAKELAATNFAAAAYAGYMWGLGAPEWVAGLEADIAYINALMDPGIPGTGAIGTAAVRANDNVTVRANWSFSLLGRLGYLVNPSTMVYLAAGPTWLNARTTVSCTAAGVCGTNGIPAFSQTNSNTLPGWTLGGGLEEKLFGNWRGRVEYRYSSYGTWSTNFGTAATLFVAPDIKLHTNTVMFGLVYSFGR